MPKTQKISISVDRNDLAWLRKRARKLGGNVSAVVALATRMMRQQEAREALLAELGDVAKISPERAQEIRGEWESD